MNSPQNLIYEQHRWIVYPNFFVLIICLRRGPIEIGISYLTEVKHSGLTFIFKFYYNRFTYSTYYTSEDWFLVCMKMSMNFLNFFSVRRRNNPTPSDVKR